MVALLLHARFYDQVIEAKQETAVQTRRDRSNDITELWVLTHDRPSLFADVTRAISSCGASIAGAKLHTGEGGLVMNIFYLQNPDGHAFGRQSDHALETLRRRARKAANGDTSDMKIPKEIKSKRAGAIPVKPRVKFLDSQSRDSTIIEIEARDRPGLLCHLAETLRDFDLDVLSAHIEVVGEKAVDAFYVRNQGNNGKISESQRAVLKTKLLEVLEIKQPKKAA